MTLWRIMPLPKEDRLHASSRCHALQCNDTGAEWSIVKFNFWDCCNCGWTAVKECIFMWSFFSTRLIWITPCPIRNWYSLEESLMITTSALPNFECSCKSDLLCWFSFTQIGIKTISPWAKQQEQTIVFLLSLLPDYYCGTSGFNDFFSSFQKGEIVVVWAYKNSVTSLLRHDEKGFKTLTMINSGESAKLKSFYWKMTVASLSVVVALFFKWNGIQPHSQRVFFWDSFYLPSPPKCWSAKWDKLTGNNDW